MASSLVFFHWWDTETLVKWPTGLCRPFSQSPTCVLFVERKKVVTGVRRDYRCTPLPDQMFNWSLTSMWMGFKTDRVPTRFHSAMIHSRMRIQRRNTHHRQPHLASEHLCLLCCLGKKKIYKSESFCLEMLQIHSKLHSTESQCPLACTIFIISLARHGPDSQIQRMLSNLAHSQPKAPSALSHHLK